MSDEKIGWFLFLVTLVTLAMWFCFQEGIKRGRILEKNERALKVFLWAIEMCGQGQKKEKELN